MPLSKGFINGTGTIQGYQITNFILSVVKMIREMIEGINMFGKNMWYFMIDMLRVIWGIWIKMDHFILKNIFRKYIDCIKCLSDTMKTDVVIWGHLGLWEAQGN